VVLFGTGGWVSEGRAARLTQAVVRWRRGQGGGDGRSVRRLAGQRGELSGSRLGEWRSKGSAAVTAASDMGGAAVGGAGVVRAVAVCERRVGGRRGGRGDGWR